MTNRVEPLPLTSDERDVIREYLRYYSAFTKFAYDDDPLDAFKITEYMCQCRSMRDHLSKLYTQIPQIVKDEQLIPTPSWLTQ